ncbi:unnamed protein product, partial [Gongylonema pulchrum]|uniref:Uncharacterized protein n=1 Tax=Gongylonema pulchrum TaxID=637853 RepID=A0A183EIW8_9BILA
MGNQKRALPNRDDDTARAGLRKRTWMTAFGSEAQVKNRIATPKNADDITSRLRNKTRMSVQAEKRLAAPKENASSATGGFKRQVRSPSSGAEVRTEKRVVVPEEMDESVKAALRKRVRVPIVGSRISAVVQAEKQAAALKRGDSSVADDCKKRVRSPSTQVEKKTGMPKKIGESTTSALRKR